ncbi:integral membrane protein [Alternaria alternata]|nr:integral membrane protein [Alternaria alternata]
MFSELSISPHGAEPLGKFAGRVSLCALHIVCGSLVFDLIHLLAHRSHTSRIHALRCLARAHAFHHQYFDRTLQFNDAYRMQNLLWHLPLELLCQLVGSTLSWLLVELTLRPTAVPLRYDLALVWVLQVARAGLVARSSGRDSNHIPYPQVPKDPYFFFVGPQYHAVHHIDPHRNFGSLVRLVDWLFGTVGTLRGRRVAMTGSQGALGQALKEQLSVESVKSIRPLRFQDDWSLGDYSRLEPILIDIDILILAHGSKDDSGANESNCVSSRAMIELFDDCRREAGSRLLPEVWFVGSEAEIHGSWSQASRSYTESKRAFVPFARSYFDCERFLYRHIVPSAFASPMGPALVSARWCSAVALWWIRRGARYVPVTYTGLAYVNFFRFLFWVKPQSASRIIDEKKE